MTLEATRKALDYAAYFGLVDTDRAAALSEATAAERVIEKAIVMSDEMGGIMESAAWLGLDAALRDLAALKETA